MDGGTKSHRTVDTRMVPTRMIPLVRLGLGVSTLLIVVLTGRMSGEGLHVIEMILMIYVLFGLTLYSLAKVHSRIISRVATWEHWADAGTFAGLLILDSHGAGLFSCGLVFSFLGAAFRNGPAAAISVTFASTAVIFSATLARQLRAQVYDLETLLIPSLALLILGGMIAHWGGFQFLLKRRLEFISGVTRISNPRLGADHVVSSFMEQLREFYDADACIIITSDLGETELRMRRVDKCSPGRRGQSVSIPPDVVSRWLSLPPDLAVVRRGPAPVTLLPRRTWFEYDVARGVCGADARELCEKLAVTLEARSLLTVPLRYRNERIGRLFLVSGRRCFAESDVFFLIQVFQHLMPVIDNIRLVDRLAADASAAERKRIARDLHDSVIQPYIGLKLGIDSLRRKFEAGILQLEDIDRVLAVNDEAVADLRRYVSMLKGSTGPDENLLAAVRSFAAKFSFATGISVEVEAAENLQVNDRLAAEAFQIISEALSNVRRHTESMTAHVFLDSGGGQLVLRVTDAGTNGSRMKTFVPLSITERAEALGGRTLVEPLSGGGSSVKVEIPL
jgi:signal transduction histidine kinase